MSVMGSTTSSLRFAKTAPRARRIPVLGVMVGLVVILSTFTNLKIGSFQPEDFVLLLLFGFCIAKFLCSSFSFRIAAELGGLFKSYGLLLLLLATLSVLSVRLPFYPLIDASF